MTANMKDFLAKVSEDKVLAEKASKLEKAELIVLAKELGFELTKADFVQPEGEISEDELTSVTGGSICACVLGGGGKMDVRDEICACVMAGVGETTSPNARCFCLPEDMATENKSTTRSDEDMIENPKNIQHEPC